MAIYTTYYYDDYIICISCATHEKQHKLKICTVIYINAIREHVVLGHLLTIIVNTCTLAHQIHMFKYVRI